MGQNEYCFIGCWNDLDLKSNFFILVLNE